MKTFFNFLKRNKLYSAINLVGLSLSMAFVLLLAVYVQRQLSTDAFQENADRIFVVTNEENMTMGYWLPRHLRHKFPEVEASSAIANAGHMEYSIEDELVYAETLYADSSFFDMFSFKLAKGSADEWKASWNRVAVSEAFARVHFADKDPVGRQVVLNHGSNGRYTLTVAGVFEDFGNSIIKSPDILVRGELCTKLNSANNERMSNGGSAVCFVMTYPNADLQARRGDVLEFLKEIFWVYENYYKDVRIIPLRDMFFLSSGVEDGSSALNFGNRSLVMLLLAMCIILLLFAVLNYVNMTTALIGFRAKEMATRRLVGASRGSIFLKTIMESTVMCALAMLLAVLLAEYLSPLASTLLNYPIGIVKAITPANAGLMLLMVALVGFLAGIVPALIIQRVKPIEIVRGTLRFKTKTTYSKVIIVAQNVVTVVMLVAVLTMFLQVRSLINAPLGYNTKDILNIDNTYGTKTELAGLLEKLRALPFVEEVGLGEGIPLGGTNNWTVKITEDRWCSFQMIKGDSAYFSMLGIREKQNNHTPNAYWLNEYAFGQLGIDETVREFSRHGGDKPMQIGGIYYDFKIFPLLDKQSAALIYNYGEYPDKTPWNILVKINGDRGEAYQQIAARVGQVFPGKFFEAEYIEDMLRKCFENEERVLSIVGIFALLSLFVSALGLVAMSSYYLQQERRSAALKKVFGAPRAQVLNELVFSFLKMVGLAILIALPIGYYLMKRWLEEFGYRIHLYWWIFALSALVVLVVAALAVLWQSVRTANTNPVEALKKE